MNDVAHDTATGKGPYRAWQLFIWRVNDMVPETFYTPSNPREPTILPNDPAFGWMTESYDKARVLMPPADSDSKIAIVADEISLYPVWDLAMRDVVSGNIHTHEGEQS